MKQQLEVLQQLPCSFSLYAFIPLPLSVHMQIEAERVCGVDAGFHLQSSIFKPSGSSGRLGLHASVFLGQQKRT